MDVCCYAYFYNGTHASDCRKAGRSWAESYGAHHKDRLREETEVMSVPEPRKHTPGPWGAAVMVGENGERLTPEEIGEYVKNSVLKTIEETGKRDFLFVWAEHADGGIKDICLVGNGPEGPWNAKLIETAPDVLEMLYEAVSWLADPSAYYSDSNEARDFRKRYSALIAKIRPATLSVTVPGSEEVE